MELEYEAARLDMQLNMIAVPVADDDERLIGAVPPEAIPNIITAFTWSG